MRIVFIGIGMVSLVLGIIGIFLPLLPTTPFLLLSAACFSRGSTRLHRWLLRLPVLGKLIDDYEKGSGVPRRAKITALLMLWGGMGCSALLLAPTPWLLLPMAAIAIAVSVMILRLPNPRPMSRIDA